jgi:hypothetical protein
VANEMLKRFKGKPEIYKVDDDTVEVLDEDGNVFDIHEYHCLPATVDPRAYIDREE